MTLHDWVLWKIASGYGTSKKQVLKGLEKDIKDQGGETVSFITLQNAEGGKRLSKFTKAEAIEKATQGHVTVKELCS